VPLPSWGVPGQLVSRWLLLIGVLDLLSCVKMQSRRAAARAHGASASRKPKLLTERQGPRSRSRTWAGVDEAPSSRFCREIGRVSGAKPAEVSSGSAAAIPPAAAPYWSAPPGTGKTLIAREQFAGEANVPFLHQSPASDFVEDVSSAVRAPSRGAPTCFDQGPRRTRPLHHLHRRESMRVGRPHLGGRRSSAGGKRTEARSRDR